MKIELPQHQITEFCRRWRITELALFGSVLRDDFRPDSDVDVLVTFAPGAEWDWRDVDRMSEELSTIIRRNVDLVERRLVERNRNYIIRKHILRSAEPVYVA
ncbi:MAG: nucleotidyltransferase domain-containing protein [Gemmatimonadetes bacterium]|nr:nucleotidyltransferase domain-containing protein [Gemmatimonadota bacterium]